MVLIVIVGLWISSIRYSSRKEGVVINTRITAGAIVQINSIVWPSSIYRFTFLLMVIDVIKYNTDTRIIVTIIRV